MTPAAAPPLLPDLPPLPVEPACYGVACPAHEHCARYHAAEGRPRDTIPTCADAHGVRTLYLRTERAPAAAGAAA